MNSIPNTTNTNCDTALPLNSSPMSSIKVVVDADACPVKEIIVKLCKSKNIDVVMVMDTSHIYEDGYSKVITVDKGADSADFVIVNAVKKNDIAITGDIGLASMLLLKKVYVVHYNGFIINDYNIEKLLFDRHINREARKLKKRTSKIKKRTLENDIAFENVFKELLNKVYNSRD